jgi:hypothetical protein
MQPPDIGEVREALACVVGDIDRAESIIDRIREHIKKAPGQNDRFDLNDGINEIIALVLGAAAKSYVSVVARLTKGLHSVQGDRVQLQQVDLDLILNAVEAMGSVEVGARDLSITTEQDERGALVAVYDTGPGIDAEHLEFFHYSAFAGWPRAIALSVVLDEYSTGAARSMCTIFGRSIGASSPVQSMRPAPRDDVEPHLLRHGDQIALGRALDEAALALQRDERRPAAELSDPLHTRYLPRRSVRT